MVHYLVREEDCVPLPVTEDTHVGFLGRLVSNERLDDEQTKLADCLADLK